MSANYITPLSDKQTEQAGDFMAAEMFNAKEINAITAAEVLQASANAAKHLHQLLEILSKAEKRPSSDLARVTAPELFCWIDMLEEWSHSHYLTASNNASLFAIAEQLAGASEGLNNITIYFNSVSELAKLEASSSMAAQIAYAGYCLARDTTEHLAAMADSFYSAHEEQGGLNEQ